MVESGRCFWCGLAFGRSKHMKPTWDHLVPKHLGGSWERSNLVRAHSACNSIRGCDNFATAARVRKERPKRHRGAWSSPAGKAVAQLLTGATA